MSTFVSRAFVVLAAALALAGCGASEYLGKPKEPDPNLFPAKYREEILDTLRQTLEEPTNIRDAMITEPVLITVAKEQRYTVCVRENSRDSAKRYKGAKEHIAYFFAGRLNQLLDADKGQCAKAAYKPFPELEKLCLGKSCE